MASADDEREGDDGRTMTKGGGGRWTNISVIFVLLLVVISQVHVVNSAGERCYVTPIGGVIGKAQPTEDVQEAVSANQTIAIGRMCYVLYMLDSGGTTNPTWNIKNYRYLASSDTTFDVKCRNVLTKAAKSNDVKCSLLLSQNSYGDANRTDFVCCCKGDLCNDPRGNDAVNPRIQYTQQLNASDDAACYVNFKLRSPMNCTGKQSSQSMCYSQIINGTETLDCAQADNGTDHCHWTNGEDGVCRTNGDTLECCCSGAFCNGDAMMDMSCRSQYQNSTTADDLRYGAGSCKAHRPTTPTTTPQATTIQPTTLSSSQPTTVQPTEEAAEAEGLSDTTMLIIVGLECVGMAVLLAISCILCHFSCKLKRDIDEILKNTAEQQAAMEQESQADPDDEENEETSVEESASDAVLECSSECTGFLGVIEYGYAKQMTKSYDLNVTKGYKFDKARYRMNEKYLGVWLANLMATEEIKMPTNKADPLIIVSHNFPSLIPINRWWELQQTKNDDEGCREMRENMFLVNYCLAAQAMQAVTFLNSKEIDCYNIKCNNLLADTTRNGEYTLDLHGQEGHDLKKSIIPTIMLTDFLFPDIIAKYVQRDKEKALVRPRSNLEWFPPEVRTDYAFSQHTQSYMCGATILELWSMGKKPFAAIPDKERSCLYGEGKKAGDTPPLPECIPKGSYIELLMTRMTDKDPVRRPWPYEAAHSLRYIYINYKKEFFGPKARFEKPAEQWQHMMPNLGSINEGPFPMYDLPVLKLDWRKGGIDETEESKKE